LGRICATLPRIKTFSQKGWSQGQIAYMVSRHPVQTDEKPAEALWQLKTAGLIPKD
jgi:hypothetical protein